jgi:hypothetical protein
VVKCLARSGDRRERSLELSLGKVGSRRRADARLKRVLMRDLLKENKTLSPITRTLSQERAIIITSATNYPSLLIKDPCYKAGTK